MQLQLLKVVRYADGTSARGLAALRSDRGPYTCVDGGGTEAFGCSLGVVVAMLLSVRVWAGGNVLGYVFVWEASAAIYISYLDKAKIMFLVL